MFYEMVTERKAFDRDDIESLRQSIIESTPTPPIHVNPKVHPGLSDLIMKALEKDPANRYQTGRELLDDLEKCKESKSLAAKKPEAAKGTMAPAKAQASAQSKFIAGAGKAPASPAASARPASPAASRPAEKKAIAPPVEAVSKLARPTSSLAVPKAAAAAAGVGGSVVGGNQSESSSDDAPELDLSNHFISSCVKATIDPPQPTASMSSAVADEVEAPQIETFEPQANAPKIAVDHMMAEGRSSGGGGISFSEMTELPPLKEAYVPPPPPASTSSYQPVNAGPAAVTVFEGGNVKEEEEKPRVQPRVVAQKAIKEIKGVPPKLMLYALSGAGILILLIGLGVTLYIHSLNDDDPGSKRPTPVAETTAQPEASDPAPKKAAPVSPRPVETAEPEPAQPVASSKSRNAKKKAVAAPLVIPGQLALDSTPQGAQVQIDGRSDPSYVTPFAVTNLQPGQHTITVSKAGYGTDTRTVAVTSGNRATAVIHLAQLMATLVVKSDPVGANIFVDGRDVGAKTPAQVSVDKGQHVVLVRMPGYIDETMNAQFVLGQTFNFAPTLRALGNTDNIKTVGKMSKLFGGKGAQAGQAVLSIKTTPKGAQIALNQHLLDKMSPVDVAIDPGNYVLDITLSGYLPIHKIVAADKGGKVVVDEVMQKQ